MAFRIARDPKKPLRKVIDHAGRFDEVATCCREFVPCFGDFASKRRSRQTWPSGLSLPGDRDLRIEIATAVLTLGLPGGSEPAGFGPPGIRGLISRIPAGQWLFQRARNKNTLRRQRETLPRYKALSRQRCAPYAGRVRCLY